MHAWDDLQHRERQLALDAPTKATPSLLESQADNKFCQVLAADRHALNKDLGLELGRSFYSVLPAANKSDLKRIALHPPKGPIIDNTKENKFSSKFPGLWYRIHVLIVADLKRFDSPASIKRIEKLTDPSYVGEPYFTLEEADTIKYTVFNNGNLFTLYLEDELNQRLTRRNMKRVESGNFQVCTAHDLALIIAQALSMDLKQLEEDKKFETPMSRGHFYPMKLSETIFDYPSAITFGLLFIQRVNTVDESLQSSHEV
ncbi:hypothetical protein ETB97_005667 [Aspergillus alliaceus]|uniref:Uncharacterized protein n=1 Tax=Petromyces alliaceus TaxID=209559 RepID=A0A8H5ZVB8_PETAA|nr:hypothetical protein ETB97_005667 [Aspergillus burnettii]